MGDIAFEDYVAAYTWHDVTIYPATQLGWLLTAGRSPCAWSISFNGTDPEADPVRVELITGTGFPSTATFATGRLFDPDAPLSAGVLNAGWQTVNTFSETGTLETHLVPQAGGVLYREYPTRPLGSRSLHGGNQSVGNVCLAIRVAVETTVDLALWVWERSS